MRPKESGLGLISRAPTSSFSSIHRPGHFDHNLQGKHGEADQGRAGDRPLRRHAFGRSLAPRVRRWARGSADCTELAERRRLIDQIGQLYWQHLSPHKDAQRPQMSTVRYRVMKPLPTITTGAGRSCRGISCLSIAPDPRGGGENISLPTRSCSFWRKGLKTTELRHAERSGDYWGSRGAEPTFGRPRMDRQRAPGEWRQHRGPKLYVACGISGPATLAGMRGSETIIAINADLSADISRG